MSKLDLLMTLPEALRDLRYLRDLLDRTEDRYARLIGIIEGIEDPQAQTIARLKYVDGLTWPQVAIRLGHSGAGDSYRMRLVRALTPDL